MRPSPSLARHIWRAAVGAGAAIETAAIATNSMARWLQPGAAAASSRVPDDEQALVREIEACDVRLSLLPAFDGTELDASFRRELQARRDEAAARLSRARATSS